MEFYLVPRYVIAFDQISFSNRTVGITIYIVKPEASFEKRISHTAHAIGCKNPWIEDDFSIIHHTEAPLMNEHFFIIFNVKGIVCIHDQGIALGTTPAKVIIGISTAFSNDLIQ